MKQIDIKVGSRQIIVGHKKCDHKWTYDPKIDLHYEISDDAKNEINSWILRQIVFDSNDCDTIEKYMSTHSSMFDVSDWNDLLIKHFTNKIVIKYALANNAFSKIIEANKQFASYDSDLNYKGPYASAEIGFLSKYFKMAELS